MGGKNILPMKQLSELLTDMGCTDVKTYIQSGNVLLAHADKSETQLAQGIASKVTDELSFNISVMVFSSNDFACMAKNNPFKTAEAEPKNLHLYFLSEKVSAPNLQGLLEVKTQSESFELIGHVFYLHAPDGIGRSKLAAKVEKCLGVATTARNWNTVKKLLSLANAG